MNTTIDLGTAASKLGAEEAEHSSEEITLEELLADGTMFLASQGMHALGRAVAKARERISYGPTATEVEDARAIAQLDTAAARVEDGPVITVDRGAPMPHDELDILAARIVLDVPAARKSRHLIIRRLAIELEDATAAEGEPFFCPPTQIEQLLRVGLTTVRYRAIDEGEGVEVESARMARDAALEVFTRDTPGKGAGPTASGNPIEAFRGLVSDIENMRRNLDDGTQAGIHAARLHLSHALKLLGL